MHNIYRVMHNKLNFKEWLLSESPDTDSLNQIKILIDDPNNGIKAQIGKIQKMPIVSKQFTNANLQSLFTSLSAAIAKSYDLVTRYGAYDVAAERVKNAYSTFRQLCAQLEEYTRIDFNNSPQGKTMVADLNTLYKQLQRLQRGSMQMQQPAMATGQSAA